MLQEKIEVMLKDTLDDPLVILSDPRLDGVHLEAVIVSVSFEPLSLLERHRKVKEALKELFSEELHALSIKTYTPKEWGQKEKTYE